jgi:adenosine deaminase
LGHGVRIVDDIADVRQAWATPVSAWEPESAWSDSELPAPVPTAEDVRLGRLAQYVRDKRIPLEMCPSSNVQTGAAPSIAAHPIGLLRRLYFRVTVNTDNRLMSQTSMSREMALLAETFGYGWADLQWLTVNAMKSAFIPFDERLAFITDVIKPWYAPLVEQP